VGCGWGGCFVGFEMMDYVVGFEICGNALCWI